MKENTDHQAIYNKIVSNSRDFYKSAKDADKANGEIWISQLENNSPKQRREYMDTFYSNNLERLNANFNACVKNKNSSYLSSCDINQIARSTLIPFLTTWTSPAVSHKIEHLITKLHKTCAISDTTDEQKMVNQLDCLMRNSDDSPVEAFILAGTTARFGLACPVYLAAVESVKDDIQCGELYEKFADCKSWARLTELHSLGSRTLISKREPTKDKTKNGEATK